MTARLLELYKEPFHRPFRISNLKPATFTTSFMRKFLLTTLLSIVFFCRITSAQTTGTYIVADKTRMLESCIDSNLTLTQIISLAGIRDLNDPADDATMYKMFELHGSVITTIEITGPIKYSDYSQVFVKKMNATPNSYNYGLPIMFKITVPPTRLFKKDTLKYIVNKDQKINFIQDFFAEFEFFSSNKDILPLDERLFIKDEATGIETTWKDAASVVSLVGKGTYKLRAQVSVCTEDDLYYDSIYVVVTENGCLSVEVKNLPSVCRDAIIDIRPYIYLDGSQASSTDLGQMTFWNMSNSTNQTTFDPSAMNMNQMFNKLNAYPNIEIVYQPNVNIGVGVCSRYGYLPAIKVPSKLMSTDLILTRDNNGKQVYYTIEGDYFGFNNAFNKEIFKKLYIDNYAVYNGTQFDFYADNTYESPVSGNTLSEGSYYIVATHPDCAEDSTVFKVNIIDRDFEILWKSAVNVGQGYYTFTAPSYPGATYSWMAWSGNITQGLGTNEITVYFSESAYNSPFVSCQITLPAARITGGGPLKSAVYLTTSNGEKEEIKEDLTTSTISSNTSVSSYIYPNPATHTFAISGTQSANITVYNTLGQLVYSNNSYTANTPIEIQSKGLHIVYVKQQGSMQTLKVVLQ